jgi:hypothetical protein
MSGAAFTLCLAMWKCPSHHEDRNFFPLSLPESAYRRLILECLH